MWQFLQLDCGLAVQVAHVLGDSDIIYGNRTFLVNSFLFVVLKIFHLFQTGAQRNVFITKVVDDYSSVPGDG
jgi:hypothetical protein